MLDKNVKELDKFIRENPNVSMTAMWRIGDVIYNLPEEVGFKTEVTPTENGGMRVVLDVRGRNVGLLSDPDGLTYVVDFNESGVSDPRVCFSDRVPAEIVCAEVIR